MSTTTILGLGMIFLIGFLAAIGYEMRLIEILIMGVVSLIGIYAKDAKDLCEKCQKPKNSKGGENE